MSQFAKRSHFEKLSVSVTAGPSGRGLAIVIDRPSYDIDVGLFVARAHLGVFRFAKI
jgi:hypothetical protein